MPMNKGETAQMAIERLEKELADAKMDVQALKTVSAQDAKMIASFYDRVQAAETQTRALKRSLWKHLHIKHERTVCPLSVGTQERCCEIIMRDAGLDPANGEPVAMGLCQHERGDRTICSVEMPCPKHGY